MLNYTDEGLSRYLLRENLYNSAFRVIRSSSQASDQSSLALFYRAIFLYLHGSNDCCVNLFQRLLNDRILSFPAQVAIEKIMKKSKHQKVLDTLKDEIDSASMDAAFYYCSYILYLMNDVDGSFRYVNLALSKTENVYALSLKGWLLLKKKKYEDAWNIFSIAKKAENSFVDAWMGIATVLRNKKRYREALDEYNKISNEFKSFYPSSIEKMKLQLFFENWNGAHEICRPLLLSGEIIESKRFQVLFAVCYQADFKKTIFLSEKFFEDLNAQEPTNFSLYFDSASIICRYCCKDENLLKISRQYLEKIQALYPKRVQILCELAYNYYLSGDAYKSRTYYVKALEVNPSCIDASFGLIRCAITDDGLEVAADQFNSLPESGLEAAHYPIYKFIRSKLLDTEEDVRTKREKLLDSAFHRHFFQYKRFGGLNIASLIYLDPEFVFAIVEEYFRLISPLPLMLSQKPSLAARKCENILTDLRRIVPNIPTALYMFAKIKYLCGDTTTALDCLKTLFAKNRKHVHGYILKSKIFYALNDIDGACDALDAAVNLDATVKKHPLYIMLQIIKLKRNGNGTFPAMEKMLRYDDETRNNNACRVHEKQEGSYDFHDKLFYLIWQLQMCLEFQKPHRALAVFDCIQTEFQAFHNLYHINLLKALLLRWAGCTNIALTCLNQIPTDNACFWKSQLIMADIYLNENKDKWNFISLHLKNLQAAQSLNMHVAAGNAFIQTAKYHDALQIFDQMKNELTCSQTLFMKIIDASLHSHRYSKALAYYEYFFEIFPSSLENRLKYIKILINVQQYVRAFNNAKEILKDPNLQPESMYEVLLLFIKLTQKLLYKNIVDECFIRVQEFHRNSILDLHGMCIETLFFEISKTYLIMRNTGGILKALDYFASNFEHSLTNFLKTVYFKFAIGQFSECENEALELLKLHPCSEELLVVVVTIFLRSEYKTDVGTYLNKLKFTALNAKDSILIVESFQKMGNLETLHDIVSAAEKMNMRSEIMFVKGLFLRRCYRSKEAIDVFLKCMVSEDFYYESSLEILCMLLIPDNFVPILCEEEERNICIPNEYAEPELVTCLLKKIENKIDPLLLKVFSNLILVDTKNEEKITEALTNFLALHELEIESCAVIYGICVCLIKLERTNEIKPYLDKSLKYPSTSLEWNFQEKCWLMLAKLNYHNTLTHSLPEICRTILKHNKSCYRAYELLGDFFSYKNEMQVAMEYYEDAWFYSFECNSLIGQKYVKALMKSKRFYKAMEIAARLSEKFPQLHHLKKEIIEASINIIL